MPVQALRIELRPGRLPTLQELEDVRDAVTLCKRILVETLKEQAQDLRFDRETNTLTVSFSVEREDRSELLRCLQGVLDAADPFLSAWKIEHHHCRNPERLPCDPWTVLAESS